MSLELGRRLGLTVGFKEVFKSLAQLDHIVYALNIKGLRHRDAIKKMPLGNPF